VVAGRARVSENTTSSCLRGPQGKTQTPTVRPPRWSVDRAGHLLSRARGAWHPQVRRCQLALDSPRFLECRARRQTGWAHPTASRFNRVISLLENAKTLETTPHTCAAGAGQGEPPGGICEFPQGPYHALPLPRRQLITGLDTTGQPRARRPHQTSAATAGKASGVRSAEAAAAGRGSAAVQSSPPWPAVGITRVNPSASKFRQASTARASNLWNQQNRPWRRTTALSASGSVPWRSLGGIRPPAWPGAGVAGPTGGSPRNQSAGGEATSLPVHRLRSSIRVRGKGGGRAWHGRAGLRGSDLLPDVC